jgi:hypothetical protein
MQALQMDNKITHTVKPSSTSAALMVEPTMKASCQAVYQDKEKTSFHVESWLARLLVAVAEAAVIVMMAVAAVILTVAVALVAAEAVDLAPSVAVVASNISIVTIHT